MHRLAVPLIGLSTKMNEIILEKKLINIRRQIHKFPELGNCETKTTKLIENVLNSEGIKTKKITKTGTIGLIEPEDKKPKMCIAFRADIDALPIEEKTKKPYSSRYKGIMHACGHDANTTMVLGSAILIKRNFSSSFDNIAIKFIFQPNEESAGGAQTMIEAGALKNPDVNYIFGIHVNPQLPTGTIGIKNGEMMASVDKFEVEIYGGGGHAAYPHKSKDTIITASEIIMSLQTLVARGIDPVEPVVISICTIQGGTKFNVLPEKVVFSGTVRTLNENLHRKMPKLIEKIVKEKTREKKLKYNFKYEVLGYPLYNDKKLVDICTKSAEKIVGKRKIIFIEKPSMGGEDFSEYLRFVPGCFLYIGSKTKNPNITWHHPEFDIDEKILLTGSKILSQIAIDMARSRTKLS